jgi:hypothetical protein
MMVLASLVFAATLDACHVLQPKDVAAVQGEAFTDTKLSTHEGSTTCFYQLPTFSKSVSVDVMRSGARAFWKKTFERDEGEERERDRGHEEAEAKRPPRKVRGVGSEAFWVGSHAAGSLWVRKGDALLRISVGGPGTDDEKIARSKQLAIAALKRL